MNIFYLESYDLKDEFPENNTEYSTWYANIRNIHWINLRVFLELPTLILPKNGEYFFTTKKIGLTSLNIEELVQKNSNAWFPLLQDDYFFGLIGNQKIYLTHELSDELNRDKIRTLFEWKIQIDSEFMKKHLGIGRVECLLSAHSPEELLILQAQQEWKTLTLEQAKEIVKDWHFGGVR